MIISACTQIIEPAEQEGKLAYNNHVSMYTASLPVASDDVRICAMRVVMLSKACIVGAYQRKLEELARLPGLELTVLVPPSWRDDRGL